MVVVLLLAIQRFQMVIGGGDFLLKNIVFHLIFRQLFAYVHGENVFHYPVQCDCIHLWYNILDVVHDLLEIVAFQQFVFVNVEQGNSHFENDLR